MKTEEQNDQSLCSPLIKIKEGENGLIIEELKKQLNLCGPLIFNNVVQFLLQLISFMILGHLGELSLSSFSMAFSFIQVTGLSVLAGMSMALETLCGQSYGAKQNHMLGIHMQRAILVLFLVSVPIAFIWANTGNILFAVGQDPDISAEAGMYARLLIPSLLGYGINQCQVRFLQTQNTVVPLMVISGATTLLHIPVCWALVYKTTLGSKGVVIAYSVSTWINTLLLALYIKFSNACRTTWTGFSMDAFHDIPNFLRLSIPSAIMSCFGVWAFQLMVLLSGFLPNPKLEASVLSICLNTTQIIFMVPMALGATISTRVSNELGAGRAQAALLAVRVTLFMVTLESFLAGISVILLRHVWGYAFSNEEEVVTYVAAMMPVLAVSNFFDGIQGILSGMVRGCGWQKIGAFVNLGAYYLVGVSSSIIFAFVLHMGGKGLWFGLLSALFLQGLSYLIITLCTDWEEEAKRARERVYCSSLPVDMSS
ncbi:hypothetical protein MKX01_035856 [Papaver californicum]|nr:hypothetical protein MKX01_035856 [Papaver californicum]